MSTPTSKWAQILRPEKFLKKCVSFDRHEFSQDEHEDSESDSNDDSGEDEKEASQTRKSSSARSVTFASPALPENATESPLQSTGTQLKSLKRRKSEILRTQYMATEELRIAVCTWNVAGKLPPDNLILNEWLKISNPADIYVIGFQEIVPLSPGNVLGVEDTGAIRKWENLIRETLGMAKADGERKCHTAPPSPWNQKLYEPSESSLDGSELDGALVEADTQLCYDVEDQSRSSCSSTFTEAVSSGTARGKQTLKRVYSSAEHLGLSWCLERTESQPVDWLRKLAVPMDTDQRFGAFPTNFNIMGEEEESRMRSLGRLLGKIERHRKERARYVRLASKQMVGLHVSVWVTRKLRRHIWSVRVSCVGIGFMGYLGNKGSVSVSLTLHQTSLCFVCTHLSHGEKEGDELRRNADVVEILKRTRFPTSKASEALLPTTIMDHDRVVLLGDLNYRLNLSDSETRALVEKKKWQTLLEKDQLKRELYQGRVFEGWREGPIHFAPTYKYEMDSDEYTKPGEKMRTPAWCDRILWFGDGLKLLSYMPVPSTLSDHRPVNAVFLTEVEVLSEVRLIKALNALPR